MLLRVLQIYFLTWLVSSCFKFDCLGFLSGNRFCRWCKISKPIKKNLVGQKIFVCLIPTDRFEDAPRKIYRQLSYHQRNLAVGCSIAIAKHCHYFITYYCYIVIGAKTYILCIFPKQPTEIKDNGQKKITWASFCFVLLYSCRCRRWPKRGEKTSSVPSSSSETKSCNLKSV